MSFRYRGRAEWRVAHPLGGYGDETCGSARIPGPMNAKLAVIFSDGEGWEHVSVSLKNRCPNWPEMVFIKALFWDDEDCVVQFHPPRSQYVDKHPFCLHLWRPIGRAVETPPMELVG